MCDAGEFIVQPPFDPSFTMPGGEVAYIIRKSDVCAPYDIILFRVCLTRPAKFL